ncbi:MAG: hypothetical protein KC776_41290 [Myxococcales bacterium]|nr:hypothetical protein [Myxococcales bacterium]
MSDIRTNRDLYRFVAALTKRHAKERPPLEDYLERLRAHARAAAREPGLSPARFAALLAAAFEDAAPTVRPTPAESFAPWDARISAQIRDLKEMRDAGTFDDEYRYFGVSAPSGAYWYNFDPCSYLECAMAGSFGGWEEGDDTGRMLVPGPVATLDAAGNLVAADPRDLQEPTVELPLLSWEELTDFLEAGQSYE